MPEMIVSSWADEIDEDETTTLPPPSEKVVGDTKILTEYTINDDGKKTKIVRTFKVVKKMVPKSIARRKQWDKFGMSRNDRPGPDPSTTIVTDEIFMQFLTGKDEHEKDDGNKTALERLKDSNKGVVKCRICKEDHWTTMCPYKDTLGPLQESLAKGTGDSEENKAGTASTATSASDRAAAGGGVSSAGKYVPPSKRDGAKTGDAMPDRRRTDDTAAIRVSNLSENTQEGDLQELFKPFGSIARIYLAKDKITGQCKGFAFINYYKKEDAGKAIATLNGYGYDHLILSVEWAKPSGS